MKRKIKKKNEKFFNKQTSTDDKAFEEKKPVKLFQKQPSNNITNNTINNNSQTNDNLANNNFMYTLENKIKRTISEENLLNAVKETDKLKNILIEKKEEFENDKKKFTNELLLLNNNIKEKSSQLELSSNNSKIILSKLNQLNSRINEEYQKIKLSEFVKKSQSDNITNKPNYNEIKNAKKQILLNHTIIDKFKIHKEKLEKIVEENKDAKIINLNIELDKIKSSEKELKSEIEKMRLIKATHERKCIKIKEELENNLERIKNEYNLQNKIKDENKSQTIKKQISFTKIEMKSLPNIYKNIIIPENDEKKSNLQSRNDQKKQIYKEKRIQKDFEELQEQIKNKIKVKSQRDIKNYINSRKEKSKDIDNNNLFSLEEKNFLKDFIPEEILKIYQNKFQTIKNENNQIEKILQKNESKKKLIEEKNQYEFIKVKKEHNIQKKNVELNSKIFLITKDIKKINKEINELQKELDKINIIYNTKKLDNDKFKETWVTLYNEIKNKKIIVKKDETVTEEELKYINKFGKISEKDGIIIEEKSDKNESDIIKINAN